MKVGSVFDSVIACAASFCVPGVGQVFRLRYKFAAACFFAVAAGYILFPPAGLAAQIFSAVDAWFEGGVFRRRGAGGAGSGEN